MRPRQVSGKRYQWPNVPEVHNRLGTVLTGLGKHHEAESSFKKAIAIKQDYGEAHQNLGDVLLVQGRLSEAETHCRHAITYNADLAEAHCALSIVLYGSGDIDAAIVSIEQAISIKPDFKTYSVILRVLQKRSDHKDEPSLINDVNGSSYSLPLPRKVYKLHRKVEKDLIAHLYKLETLDLKEERDPSYGSVKGSAMPSIFCSTHTLQ